MVALGTSGLSAWFWFEATSERSSDRVVTRVAEFERLTPALKQWDVSSIPLVCARTGDGGALEGPPSGGPVSGDAEPTRHRLSAYFSGRETVGPDFGRSVDRGTRSGRARLAFSSL